MNFTLSKWHMFVVGLIGGLLIFAVGREVAFVFLDRPSSLVFDSALRWIGTFRWLYEYQTLIALIGAWWAAKAVYVQIDRAEKAEESKQKDKREAGRALLPFALSSISDYAEQCCEQLRSLLEKVERGILPQVVEIAPFAELPVESISSLRDLVEVTSDLERVYLSTLLSSMQVQSSRLRGLRVNRRRDGHIILELNLERYIVDAAEIYAQAAALYKYARQPNGQFPTAIKRQEIASALQNLGIFDDLYDKLVERYTLASEALWTPPFTAAG